MSINLSVQIPTGTANFSLKMTALSHALFSESVESTSISLIPSCRKTKEESTSNQTRWISCAKTHHRPQPRVP